MAIELTSAPTQVHDIPADIAALCPIGPDYTDVFTSSFPAAAAGATAEEWARATIEGASAAGRFLAWRVLCGLRLDGDSAPGHVAGWKIADVAADWIRVEARSWFMTANMVFKVDGTRVWFATYVRYDRAVGRLIWTPVSAVHRRVAPDFLRGGVRRTARRAG